MMEISQDWFEDLKSPLIILNTPYIDVNCTNPTYDHEGAPENSVCSKKRIVDHQQQTYVTKHDLELLHKKIIATDLIVQKYQEANRALCRLQSENDVLKQQVEQTTNECCIFSRQVTECTQECDDLKEQIESLNSENRELNQQLRVINDENTSKCHEIMVLKQYESLKETNDQLSKTVERQQKNLAKLQLQLQRKTPIAYKPVRNPQEPSETDIALVHSQKSVRELKLALGRLVNFIELSKVEIPIALNIRPVLKAHGISDDFVEIESGFVLKPVKKVSKRVITPVAVDDDEDEDNNDYIDVNHTAQPPPVLDAAATTSVDVTEKPATSSKSSSRQRSKKKPVSKPKTTKKSRHRKDKPIQENSPTKLDDLANKLEFALSQPDQQSPLLSFFSDDDNTEKLPESTPAPVYTPIMSQSSDTYPGLRSTITIIPKSPVSIPRRVSFFSDDDNDDKLPSSSPISAPIVEPPSILTRSLTKKKTIPTSPINHVTPMEVETPNKPTKHVSFLSEDDDDDEKEMSQASLIDQQLISNEHLSTLENNANDDESQVSSLSTSQTLTDEASQSTSTPSTQTEIISDDNPVQTNIPANALDSKHVETVFRLLQILAHVPTSFKPLRLFRRRIQQRAIPELVEEHPSSNEMNTNLYQDQISVPIEEQRESIEETSTTVDDNPTNSAPVPMDESNDVLVNDTPEEQQTQMENIPVDFIDPYSTVTRPTMKCATPKRINLVQSAVVERPVISKNEEAVSKVPEKSVPKPFHLSVLSRLLNTLTTLPVKPLVLPVLPTSRKMERQQADVHKPSTVLSRPKPCLSTRMETRSINSIRACIARCNQPTTRARKRTTTELSSSAASSVSNAKRMRTTTAEPAVKRRSMKKSKIYQ